MKTIKNAVYLLIVVSFLSLFSCGGDDSDPGAGSGRAIKFEVTGNFSGSALAVFAPAGGGSTSEDITSLPWTREITYASSVTHAFFGMTGAGGVAGQTVTVKVYAGGVEVSSTPGTVLANGAISVTVPPYAF